MNLYDIWDRQEKQKARGKYISFVCHPDSEHRRAPEWQRTIVYCPGEDEVYLAVEALQGGMLAALASAPGWLQSGGHMYASMTWITENFLDFRNLDTKGFRDRVREAYEKGKKMRAWG